MRGGVEGKLLTRFQSKTKLPKCCSALTYSRGTPKGTNSSWRMSFFRTLCLLPFFYPTFLPLKPLGDIRRYCSYYLWCSIESWNQREGTSRHLLLPIRRDLTLECRKILGTNWFILETSRIILLIEGFLHSVIEIWDFQAQYQGKWLIWMKVKRERWNRKTTLQKKKGGACLRWRWSGNEMVKKQKGRWRKRGRRVSHTVP